MSELRQRAVGEKSETEHKVIVSLVLRPLHISHKVERKYCDVSKLKVGNVGGERAPVDFLKHTPALMRQQQFINSYSAVVKNDSKLTDSDPQT